MEPKRLFKQFGYVQELEFDDAFKAHLRRRASYEKHRVSIREINEVLLGIPAYFVNALSGRAPLIMVGPTLRNRFLCVPIEPTERRGIWRPVTAFEANKHHIERYAGGQ